MKKSRKCEQVQEAASMVTGSLVEKNVHYHHQCPSPESRRHKKTGRMHQVSQSIFTTRSTNNLSQTNSKTMKSIIVVCLLAVALARPQTQTPVPIVSQQQEIREDGSYSFKFETGDGISRQETGAQKQITPEEAGQTSQGGYSYTAPDGTVITMSFVADENGFQPRGDHIPTPPPMPDHVVKLLATLRAAGVL